MPSIELREPVKRQGPSVRRRVRPGAPAAMPTRPTTHWEVDSGELRLVWALPVETPLALPHAA
jgi:hypothetical protein